MSAGRFRACRRGRNSSTVNGSADGVEIKLCVWADTETGEVLVAAAEGGRIAWTVDDAGREVVRKKWASFRPPLALVPAVESS